MCIRDNNTALFNWEFCFNCSSKTSRIEEEWW